MLRGLDRQPLGCTWLLGGCASFPQDSVSPPVQPLVLCTMAPGHVTLSKVQPAAAGFPGGGWVSPAGTHPWGSPTRKVARPRAL